MLALERRNLILEKLQEEKKVVVSELSQLYGVSEETIRRDLDKLDKDGLAVKSYGGAVINENTSIDMPFNVRKKKNVAGKQKIAELIAEMIQDGDHIAMDASTTSVFIAKAITQKEWITLVTNSIEIVIELADVSGWDIISSGGRLKEGYLALVGPKAIEALDTYNVEIAIVSGKGFDLERGLTDSNEEFAQPKRVMMKSAKHRIVAVDKTKFGKISFAQIAGLSEMDIVVTDEKPADEWLERFKQMGVRCYYPGR